MTHRQFQIVAIIAVIAFAGAFGTLAIGMGRGEEGGDCGLVRHLHKLGEHIHGRAHHQDGMAAFIEQLELTPDQQQRLERIHRTIGGFGGDGRGSMTELHERLMGQLAQGEIEAGEVRQMIDSHVEQIRTVAYDVTDELVALVNGLDDTQREKLLTHLQSIEEKRGGWSH